jgi:hypothetical protein
VSYKVTKGRSAKPQHPATPQVRENDGKRGFQTFEDLGVYEAAREFRKAMYGVTRRLADFEKYDFASQINATDDRSL